MPRLAGYIHREHLNVYDSLSPREIDVSKADNGSGAYLRLFGNQNVGHLVRSNIVNGGQFGGDVTAVIGNWYARTNIDTALPAFQAWAHATTVTFEMGSMLQMQLPLVDLLKRSEGDTITELPEFATDAEENERRRMALGRRAFGGFWSGEGAESEWGSAFCKERWITAAEAVLYGDVPPCAGRPLSIIVPVRQSYAVVVNSDPAATRALVETMPTNVAPQSLIWVHLEGVIGRLTA